MDKIHILSTRILEPTLTKKLEFAGFTVESIPFIEIQFVQDFRIRNEIEKLFKEKIVAIFTSSNAIEAISGIHGSEHADWKIFCTESTTKRLVTERFGTNAILGAADNSEALAKLVIDYRPDSWIHFFCGDLRRDELPGLLVRHKIKLKEWVVYHTQPVPQMLSNPYQAIIFYSPSGVRSFFSANQTEDSTVLFAIGETTALELRNYGKNRIIFPVRPSTEELVDKLIAYFQDQQSTINR
ncbi:MAG: uroporphyrinogen-III synthase [Chitinophagales bacterium]